MGKEIVNRVNGIGWVAKISLVTAMSFIFSMLLHDGWYSPRWLTAGSAAVTKSYPFTSDSESWVGTAGTATTNTWTSGTLRTTITGKKVNNATAGWQLTGVTWESLGVPAGATVVSVDGRYDWNCATYTTGTSGVVNSSGDLTITDAADANITTLESGLTFTGTTTLATRNAATAVAVPAALQASNSSIKIKLLGSLETTNVNGSVTRVNDNVSLIINYTTTAPVMASPTVSAIGSTAATLGATISASGGTPISDYGIVWNTTGSPTTASNKIVKGTTTFTGAYTVTPSNLPAGTRVFYAGYATNTDGTSYTSTGSFYTEPATQASNVQITGVTSTGMTISWTNGGGDGALVLMKAASAVTGAPADGTYTYTASTTFGSGTLIGDGRTVYKGLGGNSVAVTGLTTGTTYHVSVFAAAGSSTSSGLNIGTNYLTTAPATGSAQARNNTATIGTVTVTPTSATFTSASPTVSASVTLAGETPSGCEYTTDGSSPIT